MMRQTVLAIAAAGVVSSAVSAELFTFNRSLQGWSVFNINFDGQPLSNPQPVTNAIFDGGFGLPPGSLNATDLTGETWVGVLAGVQGDHSALLDVGNISYDIFYTEADNATYAAVGIYGGGLTLYRPHDPPALNQWLHWEFPFVACTWSVGSINGAKATDAQMLQVLGDLKGVFIHTEWKSGPDDTNVDNISLNTSSTPGRSGCCTGDLDGNGVVDGADLGLLLANWSGAGLGDLDASSVVDGADLGLLLAAWGACL